MLSACAPSGGPPLTERLRLLHLWVDAFGISARARPYTPDGDWAPAITSVLRPPTVNIHDMHPYGAAVDIAFLPLRHAFFTAGVPYPTNRTFLMWLLTRAVDARSHLISQGLDDSAAPNRLIIEYDHVHAEHCSALDKTKGRCFIEVAPFQRLVNIRQLLPIARFHTSEMRAQILARALGAGGEAPGLSTSTCQLVR